MGNYIKTKLFIIALLCGCATLISGQNFTFKGQVIDSNGDFPLPGANIYLKSSPSSGAVTDFEGIFEISGMEEGSYVFIVSYISYEEQEITVEIPQQNEGLMIISMEPSSILGEEVIITAQALGQAKAINQQLNSDAIGNFISVEKIKELPDVNAAEAISRLPGVAINRSGGEGSKIVVRGLDPKFTAISVNGVRLPSTSGTDRSVDLSLISPELLSGIELFKSPTPDMDGDALGGAVNLTILKAPKDRRISFKGLGGYNFISSSFRDYKATFSMAQRFLNDKIGFTATANTERFNRGGETLRQGWIDNNKIVLDTLLDIYAQEGRYLEFEERQEIRRRQNGSIGLDFNLGKRSEFNILGIYSNTSRDRFDYTERYDVFNNRTNFTPNTIDNSITLYSGSLSARHNINKLTLDWGASYSQVEGKTPTDFSLQFANDTQPFDPEVFSRRNTPANFYDYLQINDAANYLLSGQLVESSNQETSTTSFLNLNLQLIQKGKTSLNFKFGGKTFFNTKERNYLDRRVRNYYLTRNSHFEALLPESTGALGVDPSGDYYFGMSNFVSDQTYTFKDQDGESLPLISSVNEAKLLQFKELFDGDFREYRYTAVNNYSLEENVYASYAMLKFNYGTVLSIIPGFRYEYSDNIYKGVYSDLDGQFGESGNLRDVEEAVNYGLFLPHLHVKYKPLDWFDVRMSYSTTLARPDYNYVVPSTLVNRSSDLRISQGNPNLEASVSTNYDLYLTAYSGKLGLISIGGFYKDIKNAFYPFIVGLNNDSLAVAYGFQEDGFTGAELTTYVNSPDSYVTGYEIDLQSNLNFLPKPFDGLVLNLNYSRLFSRTTINSFYEESELQGTFPFIYTVVYVYPYQREVDLIGQARQIFNVSLGYDINDFSMRLSGSYQGSKLSGYSSSADKDQYNAEFWRFDAVIKQRFGSKFNVFLNLNNISDQKDINFFRSKDLTTSIARYGTTATIGAEYIIR